MAEESQERAYREGASGLFSRLRRRRKAASTDKKKQIQKTLDGRKNVSVTYWARLRSFDERIGGTGIPNSSSLRERNPLRLQGFTRWAGPGKHFSFFFLFLFSLLFCFIFLI
jgi:hypothetical protein